MVKAVTLWQEEKTFQSSQMLFAPGFSALLFQAFISTLTAHFLSRQIFPVFNKLLNGNLGCLLNPKRLQEVFCLVLCSYFLKDQ